MIRISNPVRAIAVATLAISLLATDARAQPAPSEPFVGIRVKAGRSARKQTPIRFELDEGRLGEPVRQALDDGPVALRLTCSSRGEQVGSPIQVDRSGDPRRARATFVLPVEILAGEEAQFLIAIDRPWVMSGPWSIADRPPIDVELRNEGRRVFRYNASPVSSPNYKEIQVRDAYIHPAYSPSGALITGDFSSSHPHHRGFFLAYERTKVGELSPDFWNIHLGTGKIYADGVDSIVAGPVSARFSARHRWEAKDKATGSSVVVLRERWDVEAYSIPGSPYWLFDLTSTQQAVARPVEVLPYRYGGMAYRGPEPFVKGLLDVLTGEGKHRKDGDQKPTRWVDLTGPVAEGSESYAGAMIADHPSNPHYPNVARIHPTTLPFFCFVPAYERAVTLTATAPTVFRYRAMIHDGRPDPKLDESVALDFAEPPVVVVD